MALAPMGSVGTGTVTLTPTIISYGVDVQTLYRALQDFTTVTIGYVVNETNTIINTLKPLLDISNAAVSNIAARLGMFELRVDSAFMGLFGELATLRTFASFIPTIDQRVTTGLMTLAGALQGMGLAITGIRDGVVGLYPFIGGFLDTQNRILTTFPTDIATAFFDIFYPHVTDFLDVVVRVFKERFVEVFQTVHEVLMKVFQPYLTEVNALGVSIVSIPSSSATGRVHSLLSQLRANAESALNSIQRMQTLTNVLEIVSLGQIDNVFNNASFVLQVSGVVDLIRDGYTLEYQHGIRPQIIREINATYQPMLPSPSELVTMVVREAFDPAFVTPAPDTFAYWMSQLGFSREWSDRYWTAHWRWLPNETAIEMFHRGIIDENTLAKTFIINDVHPQTLPYWLKFVYRLPNRVEARIMGRFGLLTPEQMQKILKAEGIDPEFIPALATMIFEYHLGSLMTKLESFAINAYEDGYISPTVFTELMREARFPDSVTNAALKLADLKRRTQIVETKRKLTVELAKKGLIEPGNAANILRSLGIVDDVVASDLEIITAYRTLGEEKTLENLQIKLVTEAINAYDDGVVTDNEFAAILAESGLPQRVVQSYLNLGRMKKFWSVRREYVKAWLVAYRRGVVDYQTAYNKIVEIGLSPEFAAAKLEAIRIELETKKPKQIDVPGDKLTVSQILKALKEGVISVDEAATFLAAKGYDSTEISVILNTALVEIYRKLAAGG